MTTAGRPVGIAEIANAIAAVKTVSKLSPRDRLRIDRDGHGRAGDDEDLARQLLQLLRQRRVFVLGASGACARCGRPRSPSRSVVTTKLPGAAGHVRVHEDHVGPVAERRVRPTRPQLDALRDRQALARQRRLGDLERRRRQQPPVGGHDVARLDRDDVARDELLRRDLHELAVAAHARLDDHHLLQRRDRLGRLALLAQPEHGVEQRQEEQDEAGAELVERIDAADPGHEQHDLHRVAVLAHERAPAWLDFGDGELVRPDRSPAATAASAPAETAGGVDADPARDLVGLERIPRDRCLNGRPLLLRRRHRFQPPGAVRSWTVVGPPSAATTRMVTRRGWRP